MRYGHESVIMGRSFWASRSGPVLIDQSSWAGIGRIRQCLDLSNRRAQAAGLENIGSELRQHRIGPDFGADAFDLDQELRRLLDELRRLRCEPVSQRDADVSAAARFRSRAKGRFP